MLIFPLKKQLRSAQNALNLPAALTGSTGARRCLMSHECHESEYSKFLKSLGIDKEKMLADMESRLPEDERNRLRKMRLERIEELEKENAELKEKLKPENCLKLLAKEGYIKFTSEQLTRAKEIIQRLMHELVVSNIPYDDVKMLVDDVEKFLQED